MNRRTLLTALVAMIFAIVTLAHPPGRAYACSCIQPSPPADARDQSDAVFAGTVTAVGQVASGNSGDPVSVVFDLSESWKGPTGPSLTIKTSQSSASCGYEFVPGKQYLVYASVQDGGFTTGLCTRTATLDAAAADLQILGAGQGVTPAAQPEPAGIPWLPLIAGVAVVGGLALLVARRRAA